jgi:hypothetical protein
MRPKVEEKDKRVIQVNIRITIAENDIVIEQATASGLSPANWIRYKVFTGEFPRVKLSPLDASIYHELKKIGVNLNQAAHKLNQGDKPDNLQQLLNELLLQLSHITKLLSHDRNSDKG